MHLLTLKMSNFKTEQKRIMELFQGATIINMFNYESGYPTGYRVLYCIKKHKEIYYIEYNQDAIDPGYYIIDKEKFETCENQTIEILKEMENDDLQHYGDNN